MPDFTLSFCFALFYPRILLNEGYGARKRTKYHGQLSVTAGDGPVKHPPD
jgi:hypothetical protein